METSLEELRENNRRSQRQYESQQRSAAEYPSPSDSHSPIPSTTPFQDSDIRLTERQKDSFQLLPAVDISSRRDLDTAPLPQRTSSAARFSNWTRASPSPARVYITPPDSSPDPIVPPPPMAGRKGTISPTTSNQSSHATITSSVTKLSPPDEISMNPSVSKSPLKGMRFYSSLFPQTPSLTRQKR